VLKFVVQVIIECNTVRIFFGKNNWCMATLYCVELSGRDKSCGVYMSGYKIVLNKCCFCLVIIKV
jgi:hypothetical protein